MGEMLMIESKFDVTKNNRPDGGNGRKYDLENVNKIIAESQWHVKEKQLLGYYGHPSTLFLREGLQNQPSNVCTHLKLRGSIVEHAQQILETDTGKVVQALHKAGAGGWSWRASGVDGGRTSGTTVTQLAGFDYVHAPSFTAIRESMDTDNGDYAKLRYHLLDEGLSADFADSFLQGVNDGVSQEMTRLRQQVDEAEDKAQMMTEAMLQTHDAMETEQKERLALVKESLARSPYKLKEEIMEILAKGVADTQELRLVMETLTAYQEVDFKGLPLNDQPFEKTPLKERFEETEDFDWNQLFDRTRSW